MPRRKLRNAERRARVEFLMRWKAERGCQTCGERDPIVLDCDHIGPKNLKLTRAEGPSRRRSFMRRQALVHLGWAAFLQELKQVQVLCANCHRRKTHAERLAGQSVAVQVEAQIQLELEEVV